MNTQTETKWEKLANEALADAGYWKSECRKLQAEHAALVAVAEFAADSEWRRVDPDGYEVRMNQLIANLAAVRKS